MVQPSLMATDSTLIRNYMIAQPKKYGTLACHTLHKYHIILKAEGKQTTTRERNHHHYFL